MHRPDRGSKPNHRKSGPPNKEFGDGSMEEMDPKYGRQGRRQWQQEKQLLKQLDPKTLDEYLLDNE